MGQAPPGDVQLPPPPPALQEALAAPRAPAAPAAPVRDPQREGPAEGGAGGGVAVVSICTGRKCRARGSEESLAAARRAAEGTGVLVEESRCMRNCGHGPCMRVQPCSGSGGSGGSGGGRGPRAEVVRHADAGCVAALMWEQLFADA